MQGLRTLFNPIDKFYIAIKYMSCHCQNTDCLQQSLNYNTFPSLKVLKPFEVVFCKMLSTNEILPIHGNNSQHCRPGQTSLSPRCFL